MQLCDLLDQPIDETTRAFAWKILFVLSATFFILCYLQVALLWLEIVLATQRLQRLQSHGELARRWIKAVGLCLLVMMAAYIATAALGIALLFYIMLGVLILVAIAIGATFQLAARRLHGLHAHAAALTEAGKAFLWPSILFCRRSRLSEEYRLLRWAELTRNRVNPMGRGTHLLR